MIHVDDGHDCTYRVEPLLSSIFSYTVCLWNQLIKVSGYSRFHCTCKRDPNNVVYPNVYYVMIGSTFHNTFCYCPLHQNFTSDEGEGKEPRPRMVYVAINLNVVVSKCLYPLE